MFDIYKYGKLLAQSLKAIGHTDQQQQYYAATDQTELHELEQNLTSAQGTILIAIDGQMSEYQFSGDNLIERPYHSIVIAKQTDSTDAQTITTAQKECKGIMDQVIAKIMCDAHSYKHNCDKVDINTMTTQGFGPIGGLFYGVILSFSLAEGVNYQLKEEYWK